MTVTTDTPTAALVPLDHRLELLRELAELEYLEQQNKRAQARIKEELKGIIGLGGVASINGMPVFQYKKTDQFAEAKFRDGEPEFYDYCLREVRARQLQLTVVQKEFPDAWDTYRVPKLQPVGSRSTYLAVIGANVPAKDAA